MNNKGINQKLITEALVSVEKELAEIKRELIKLDKLKDREAELFSVRANYIELLNLVKPKGGK